MIRTLLFSACVAVALPGAALSFERVSDRSAFVNLIGGRALTTVAVNLKVTPDGAIAGRAFGQDVTGSWTWRNGLFCREMRTAVRDVPANCQLVEQNGSTLRFTSDAGKGASAKLRLR